MIDGQQERPKGNSWLKSLYKQVYTLGCLRGVALATRRSRNLPLTSSYIFNKYLRIHECHLNAEPWGR